MDNTNYNSNCTKSLNKAGFRGCILIASAAIILPTGCGWVDSTGNQGLGAISLQAALPGPSGVIDLLAEEPQLVDLSELATSPANTLPGQPVQWRHTGTGDAILCNGLESSAPDTGNNEPDSCPTLSSATATSQGLQELQESGSVENCTVYIVEYDLSADNMIYEIHTPAVAAPIAMNYVIDFLADDGSLFEQEVSLCIHP